MSEAAWLALLEGVGDLRFCITAVPSTLYRASAPRSARNRGPRCPSRVAERTWSLFAFAGLLGWRGRRGLLFSCMGFTRERTAVIWALPLGLGGKRRGVDLDGRAGEPHSSRYCLV